MEELAGRGGWVLWVTLPAPGRSPRVVSISPMTAEEAINRVKFPPSQCQSLGSSDTYLWALLTPSANHSIILWPQPDLSRSAFGRALTWRSGGPGPHPATPTGVEGGGCASPGKSLTLSEPHRWKKMITTLLRASKSC